MENREPFEKNNIAALRLILASIVALFHFYALTGIPSFSVFYNYLSADYASKAFFIISGMLVYRSYLRSSSLLSYFKKRARRIYPGYLAVVLICATGLFFLGTVPFTQYFGAGFWEYLAANLLFLTHIHPYLPGVFQSNIETAVDGVFWTLRVEVVFYLFVPVMHRMLKKMGNALGTGLLFSLSCIWRLVFNHLCNMQTNYLPYGRMYHELANQFPGQLLYLIAGTFILLYFDRLKLLLPWILAITAAVYAFDRFIDSNILDCVWISGFVLVTCFWRYAGNFSKYGDFSYGIYIVHWPILQVMIALGLNKYNPALFLLIGLFAIGAVAALLWHLVEKRWLAGSSLISLH